MFVIKDANNYLIGFGTGYITYPNPSHTIYYHNLSPDDYKSLILNTPGWAGEWRFILLNDQGFPVSYAPRPFTPEEKAQSAYLESEKIVKDIPNWSTWTLKEALAWYDTNVQNTIAPVASLAEAKAVLTKMAKVQEALIQMLIALRNRTWPQLEGQE